MSLKPDIPAMFFTLTLKFITMKKIFFLWMTLGWLTAINAQWIQQNSGTTHYLNDVYCISEDTVVVVGNYGTILRTTNGGTQWNTITSPTTERLNRVKFADAQTGYIVGEHGTLLKSTDAGQTWQSLNTGYNNVNFKAVSCVTANILYIGGSNGLMINTNNGGTLWTNENTGTTGHIRDIQMINDTLGYAISNFLQNKIIKKNSSGNQWHEIGNVGADFRALYMLNDQEGVFLSGHKFLKTLDGGNSFISIISPSYDTEVPCSYDIYATDMNQIWIVGYVCTVGANDPGRIVKYSLNNDPNTGYINQTEVAETYNRSELHAITFYNNVGYVVGFDIDNTTGIIYKNTTGQNYFPGSGAIDELSKEIFSIKPNPAQNKVFINLKDDSNQYPAQYRITDLQGKALTPFTALQTGKPIDVSRLTKGLYLVQVQTQGQIYTQKLLIQK